MLKQPAAWANYCGLLCANYVLYLLLTWLPFRLSRAAFFVDSNGKNQRSRILVQSSCRACVRWLSDVRIAAGATPTLARKMPLCFGLVCSGILLLIASVSADRPCVFLLLAGSACLGLVTPQNHVISQTLAGPQLAGTWVSLIIFAGNFSGIIGPTVTGFVVDRTGHFFWAFVLTAAIARAGAVSYGFSSAP